MFKSELVKGARFSRQYEFPILDRTDFRPEQAIPFEKAARATNRNYPYEREVGERMENIRAELKSFKRLEISKAHMQDRLGKNLHSIELEKPEIVDAQDVIHALEKYKGGGLALDTLLDWVNVLWFTDLFEYAEDWQDSIASVMSVLEALDESEQELTPAQIAALISALEQNREYESCEDAGEGWFRRKE